MCISDAIDHGAMNIIYVTVTKPLHRERPRASHEPVLTIIDYSFVRLASASKPTAASPSPEPALRKLAQITIYMRNMTVTGRYKAVTPTTWHMAVG